MAAMNVPFELHIALRYLLAKRKQAFISVISLFSTLGVIVGVMAVIIALAIMTGLQQELRDRILGSSPHVYVWKSERHHRLPRRGRRGPPAAARRRRRAGDSRAGPAVDGAAETGAGPDQRHRSGARAASDRHRAGDAEAGSLEASERAAATGRSGRHPARQGSGGQAAASTSAIGVDADDPAGDVVADGHVPEDAAAARRRHRSASGCSSSIRPTGSCRSTSPSACSARTRSISSSCGSTTSTRRPTMADSIPPTLGERVHHAGLDRDEPAAVLRAVAREDRRLAGDRPDRHGRRAEHRRVAHSAGDGKEPRHRHPEDDGREREERDDRSS